MTYYLRFSDVSEWNANSSKFAPDAVLDVIGAIAEHTGFHVNFRGVLPADLDAFLVYPELPHRMFS